MGSTCKCRIKKRANFYPGKATFYRFTDSLSQAKFIFPPRLLLRGGKCRLALFHVGIIVGVRTERIGGKIGAVLKIAVTAIARITITDIFRIRNLR